MAAAEKVDFVLRQFDLSTSYGPCTGMTRLQRCGRRSLLGLTGCILVITQSCYTYAGCSLLCA
jgi:DNA polymerase delta, subunit 4